MSFWGELKKAFEDPPPPRGYADAGLPSRTVWGAGTSIPHKHLMCVECGSLVGNVEVHDAWHRRRGI